MIIVLDTNVIVSALLSPAGPPARIMQRWEANDLDVAVSADLLSKLGNTLKYPRITRALKLSQEAISSLVKHLAMFAIVVEPDFTLDVIQADMSDNRVLECAVGANAACIVSGDKHLLELEEYRGIFILSPASFLTLLDLEGKETNGAP